MLLRAFACAMLNLRRLVISLSEDNGPVRDAEVAAAVDGSEPIPVSASNPLHGHGLGEEGVKGMMRRLSLVGEVMILVGDPPPPTVLRADGCESSPLTGEKRSSRRLMAELRPPATVRLVVLVSCS